MLRATSVAEPTAFRIMQPSFSPLTFCYLVTTTRAPAHGLAVRLSHSQQSRPLSCKHAPRWIDKDERLLQPRLAPCPGRMLANASTSGTLHVTRQRAFVRAWAGLPKVYIKPSRMKEKKAVPRQDADLDQLGGLRKGGHKWVGSSIGED